MIDDIKVINVSDNFGRRSGLTRRKITGSPIEDERRDENERRIVFDRRCGTDRRNGVDRRDISRMNYGDNHRRSGKDRRSGDDRRGFSFL